MTAARRLWALSVLADPDDYIDTQELALVPARVRDGCRGCGHDKPAHFDLRAHNGWREHCPCGCENYRRPWVDVVLDVGIVAIIVFLLAIGTYLAVGR